MEYNSIEDLRKAHKSGTFRVNHQITVGDVGYELVPTSQSLHEALLNQTNCAVLYTAQDQQQVQEGEADQWLAVVYSFNESEQLVPVDVKGITPDHRAINEDNKIGDTVLVQIVNIPSASTVRATVDTGATYSSLHADNWEVKGQQVHFVSKALSNNVIRVPLETQQAVKSPGDDVEYRPVISLNIKINGELIKDQLFNLSDRGQMDNPMLLGQNTLEDGNFVIDPKMNESTEIDWHLINQQIQQIQAPTKINEHRQVDEDKVRQIYQTLREADVTFEDIIKVIHQDALKVMEGISY